MGKQTKFEYDLGEHVRDKITQAEGVIITRLEHITGCRQYTVQPQGADKDGKVKDSYYFDEDRLERLTKKPVEIQNTVSGGPHPQPRTSTPRKTR